MRHSGEFEFIMMESEWNVDSVKSNKYFRFNSPFMSIVIVENIKQVKKRAKLDRRNLSFCQFDFQKCASGK